MTPYDTLTHAFARTAKLNTAARKLGWDQRVMMPPGGAADRGEELATLAALAHEIEAAPRVADALAAVDEGALEPWQAANVREMRRRHAHAAAVPSALVEAGETAAARCEIAWREARRSGDFAALLPLWRPVVATMREKAAAKAEALGVSPYDALMDPYDPGRRSAQVQSLFDDLEPFLRDALPRVLERQAREPAPRLPPGPFPAEKQRELGRRLMAAVGYDFRHGRLDDTIHPFSTGSRDDARVTARWDEADFTSGLMAVLHETGHALYTRGKNRDWGWQPVASHRGMTLHESQSLCLEMQVGRSRAFTGVWAPMAREVFSGDGPLWDADNLYRWATRVEPGFIRVDADAVTYPLHIILRFRLEQHLVDGSLDPADVPEAWNAEMQRLLGVTPPNLSLGCLQDMHWYDGAFGYFPTYSLGAMAAAQLFQAAEKAEPGLHDALAKGDAGPVVAWMRAHVHAVGCLYEPDELLATATGSPLSVDAFKRHIRTRYLDGA
ncbi:MAG: carboxypeptidase M32 [Alphaproteobacteria bacterium]|nr:carboxypeptidase M32 [Alphaproteobacteria bacterium]MCB9930782.1 carboxypeptidase M32 [Alphaproteobacteria bacterium]